MLTKFFLVIFARNAWWIDLNGQNSGPYETLEEARAEAIARATAVSDEGRRSEVRVSSPAHNCEVIYRSESKSCLTRGTMLARAA